MFRLYIHRGVWLITVIRFLLRPSVSLTENVTNKTKTNEIVIEFIFFCCVRVFPLLVLMAQNSMSICSELSLFIRVFITAVS